MGRSCDRDEGFSLVETVIALTVFAIVSAALIAVVLNATALSRTDRSRVVAANLAARELETVREEAGRRPVVQLDQGAQTTTRSVGETAYTIRRTATWTTTSADKDSCTTSSGVLGNAYLRVSVAITWPRMGTSSPVRADTLLTPAIGTYSSATGNIAVKVTDRDGGGGDHVVTVEKSGARLTQRTTADGCAFFAFVEAGTYTVSLATPGYVDTSGNATPAATTTVTAAAPTASAVSFIYDRAVPVTFVDTDPAFPLATDAIVVGNDGYQPSKKLTMTFTARPFTAALFPWRDGVGIWSGGCADAQPGTPPRLALTPGTSRTAPVPAAPVSITVSRGGVPADAVAVSARHVADPLSCTSGATLALGTTDAAGRLQVSCRTAAGTWPPVGRRRPSRCRRMWPHRRWRWRAVTIRYRWSGDRGSPSSNFW